MFCISSQCRPNVSSARPEIPSDMNSPDPKLFYVNNQLKMKADRVDFGTGMPLSAYSTINRVPAAIRRHPIALFTVMLS